MPQQQGFQSSSELQSAISTALQWLHPRIKASDIKCLLSLDDYERVQGWELAERNRRFIRTVGDGLPAEILFCVTEKGELFLQPQEGLSPNLVILVCKCCDQVLSRNLDLRQGPR